MTAAPEARREDAPDGAPVAAAETVVAAEAALEELAFKHVLDLLDGVHVAPARDPELALRAALVEGEAALELGDVDRATEVLGSVRAVADDAEVPHVQRAALRFQLGCASLASGHVGEAASNLTLALDLCNRATEPDDRLRALILERRARCHRINRDWIAARADVERALELAESLADDRVIAQACLQASIVGEREGQWHLAQFYAERARQLFVELGDLFGVGRCLNNLGGLAFLLGRVDEARTHLHESFRILLDLGRDAEAAYAVSSLAQVQLRSGEHEEAERLARRALVFLGSRIDHRTEVGNAQIVLARALLGRERFDEAEETLRAAEQTLERAPMGERAAVWLAQGELALRRRDTEAGAALYRRAAEALQDFHF